MEGLLGFDDPFADTAPPGGAAGCPILVAERNFDSVYLLLTPKLVERTAATKAAIEERHPRVEVELLELPMGDPTNYLGILRQLRKHVRALNENHPDAYYSILVSSGTPHMHASWVLLAASGEIPAKIFQANPQFVPEGKSPVREIDVTQKDFPQDIRPIEVTIALRATKRSQSLKAAELRIAMISSPRSNNAPSAANSDCHAAS